MFEIRPAIKRLTTFLSLFLILFCFALASPGNAQIAGTGSIQGSVADKSGALIPNATVTLVNKDTQVKQTTHTDGAGAYVFPNISIGTYIVDISATGFQSYEQTGIVLEVGSNIAVNVGLGVGTSDVKVEVQATALSLQSEDVSFKQTIDQQDVQEMPLNGRQMTSLITLSGGASPAPGGDFTGSKYSYAVVSVSVAGGMGNTTEWKLDGGDNNDYMSNANLPFPFPDAVNQFSVESTALGPVSGMHSGGLVNVVTRSGTSKYHGTAFEFIRNNYLDATNFFASSKDTLHQNQYGGTFGGPILRNRLFGFAGFQRLSNKQASATVSMYVPTAANLAGDWSATNPCGATCTATQQLYDPLTGAAIPLNKYTTAPSYNAQALKLQKYFPTVNPAIDTLNQGLVKFAIPSEVTDNQFVTREDWNINAKNNLYARYLYDDYVSPSFFSPTNILITYLAPGNYEKVQTLTAAWSHIFTPRLVNTIHISGQKRVNLRESAPGINGNSIGINEYTALPTGLQIATSTSGKNFAWSTYCGTCSNGHFNVNTEGGSDDVTLTMGKNNIAFGGEFTRVQFNEVVGYEANGNFTFNGIYSGNGPTGNNGTCGTAACPAGNANLDFLMGALSSFQQSKEQQLALRGSIPSLYAQDTYQATKRLTILAGVRWAPEFFPTDYFNRGTTFDMASFQANKVSTIYPNAPAGIFFYGDQGVPKAFTKNALNQWNPNFGATFDPDGKGTTVIRGGIGLFYDVANFYTSNRVHQNPPFATAVNPSVSGPICFSTPWLSGGTGYGCNQVGASNNSPFPQPLVPTPANAVFPAQGQYIVMPSTFHVADTLQWTVSVQRQFGHGWMAELNYIGSKSNNMPLGIPLNQAIYTPGTWGPNGTGCGPVVTTGPAAAAAGTTGGGAVGSACSTTKNQQARFALTEANPAQGNQIQGGGGGSVLIGDTAYSNYNGLVATVQHRLSGNYSVLSNFTWSKCLNISDAGGDVAGTGFQNPFNIAADYGRCGSDYRRIFNTTVVAKSNFRSLSRAAGLVVNNWEIAPLIHTLSGGPINITSGSDISLTAVGNDRPNRVPGVNPINFVKITSAAATQANRGYLNPAAFCATTSTFNPCANPVTPGTYGNMGRNPFSGPAFFQFDAQISRIFQITERIHADFRLEAFNVLNHPNFSNPGSSNPSSSSFGEITSTTGGVGGLTARLFQASAKVSF